ncbi:uncharacterized protein N7496_000313 [Penicillium cataractarum]|uniref:Zn(2)-C6 fungal-type domain-containing protein n=1 Tax=Penicillium cataractarum TaxID=2100454 RepID=A0A9W9VU59_9EURO|nr:uncharacterized protein N7496_000313 [Penicillium cataractarum]KAJ5389245.1 hypothetical protein N7496_000313 [Penicillium cataractarum]
MDKLPKDRSENVLVCRRSHTKSRKGCIACKERHTKCDEARPSCSLCIRRGLECLYPSAPEKAKGERSSRTQLNSDDSSTSCNVKSETPSRLYEMKLFYHYLLTTSHTLTTDPQLQFFWLSWVPKVATSHEYVMDFVLALAALHLASSTLGTDESQTWLRSALQYHTRALAGFRESLKLISSEGSRASFVCSICNMVFVMGYQTVSHKETSRDPLDDFLETRAMLKMTRFLGNQSDRPQANPFSDTELQNGHIAVHQEESYDVKFTNLHNRSILERLAVFGRGIVHGNPEKEMVLKNTFQILKESIEAWQMRIGSLNFSLEVSDAFVDLLKQGDWMARIILLFHGLGMHLHSERWPIKDSGKRLVLAVLPRKNDVSSQWEDLITWMELAVNT